VSEHQQSFTTSIAAPLALCYEAIGNFDAYPQWSSPVTKIAVLDRYPDGKARRVEFEVDMKLRTVRYVLEYTWYPPNRLTWKMTEGDLADIEGSYEFTAEDPKRTTATCSQAISIGFWIPSVILRPIQQTALEHSVLEFKAEAERLAARKPTPASGRG
jgi:ribosome-associated toxin RatA of RatAB toxin-antitoxin module